MSGIRALMVTIPVRDEEQLLHAPLVSATAAVDALRAVRADIATCVVVALDRCSDRSAAIAQSHGAVTAETEGRGVGASRDTAIRVGLQALATSEAATWVASTDADTIVPTSWLTRQVMWAEQGTDLVVGTVEPGAVEDPLALTRWQERHRLAEGHHHVHGANLAMRASRWREVGGFGPLLLHEDVSLVARIRASTAVCVATDTTRVRTSGRSTGRVQGGFATYLSELSSHSR